MCVCVCVTVYIKLTLLKHKKGGGETGPVARHFLPFGKPFWQLCVCVRGGGVEGLINAN